ncbi:MAG TPA: phosphotransferase, partial [Pyrinomonadaceae bacterium]|nr:phosphotransferase [Pyrinomonadaceae bacterium]
MTSAVQKAPRFSTEDAELVAADLYGLEVAAAPLPSERDQNFVLTAVSGRRFVLKIANAEEKFDFLDLQNQIVRRLATSDIDLLFPQVIPTKNGEDIASITSADSQAHFVRLLTWLDGECFARVQPHNPTLLASLGRSLAQMDLALTGFDHTSAHRFFYWDLRNADTLREWIELLPPDRRSLIVGFLDEWEKIDWANLRFSLIHNDANDYNVLVRGDGPATQRVSAIIDYGDVVYTATVCNLAVALAYV